MWMRVKTEKFVSTKNSTAQWRKKFRDISQQGKMSTGSVVEVKDNKTVELYTFQGIGPDGLPMKAFFYKKTWRTTKRLHWNGTLVQWYVYAPAVFIYKELQGLMPHSVCEEARRFAGFLTRQELIDECTDIDEEEFLTDEQIAERKKAALEEQNKRYVEEWPLRKAEAEVRGKEMAEKDAVEMAVKYGRFTNPYCKLFFRMQQASIAERYFPKLVAKLKERLASDAYIANLAVISFTVSFAFVYYEYIHVPTKRVYYVEVDRDED